MRGDTSHYFLGEGDTSHYFLGEGGHKSLLLK